MFRILKAAFLLLLIIGCDNIENASTSKKEKSNKSDERIVNWTYSLKESDSSEINLNIEAEIRDGWMLYTNNEQVRGPVPAKFEYNQHENLVGETLPLNPQTRYDTLFEGNTSYFINKGTFSQRLHNVSDGLTVYITYQAEALSNGKCPLFTDTLNITL